MNEEPMERERPNMQDLEEWLRALHKRVEALEDRHKPRFWWHGQNLKKDKDTIGRPWFYRRGWLHDRRSNFELGLCLQVPSRFTHAYIQLGDCDHQITVSLACPLFALWIHVEGIRWLQRFQLFSGRYGKEREIKFSLFEWALFWRLWVDPWGHSSRTPKWRDGSLHFDDLVLGKRKYTCDYGFPVETTFEMPEGPYKAIVRSMVQTWKRPRWPRPYRRIGYDIDIPDGVPIPGKGENSWDCGEDAVMATGSNAATVEGAMADLVKSVMLTRQRYGGQDWRPSPKQESERKD